MKRLILFIFTVLNIFSAGLEGLHIEHGLILDDNGLYTGTIYKDNMKSKVEIGVITNFYFTHSDKILFFTPVIKNKFEGNAIIYHNEFGEINASYSKGYLSKLNSETFFEEWNNNIFVEGKTKNSTYRDASKTPYIEFFDKYSFNVLQNFFEIPDNKNGILKKEKEMILLSNSKKIKKYIEIEEELEVSVPLNGGDSYIISISNIKEGKLYQGRIESGQLKSLVYSDINGPALIEEYRHNKFYRGRSLRNALVYKQSQMVKITKLIRKYIVK